MNTYNRNFPRNPEHITQIFVQEKVMPDGTSVFESTETPESPYKGLDADSFSLSSMIRAGVPLNSVSPRKLGSSIGSIDSVSEQVSNLSKNE